MTDKTPDPCGSASSTELGPTAERVRCGSCDWHGTANDVIVDIGPEDRDEVCPECRSSNLHDA